MQVMDIVDRLFVEMFDGLNQKCEKELEAINRQYPFQKLKVDCLSNWSFTFSIESGFIHISTRLLFVNTHY